MTKNTKRQANGDPADALRWISGILHSKRIPFQVTGGLAAKVYGSDRELEDIDLDISEEHFDSLQSEVSAYIVFGPSDFQDRHWRLKLLTLEYGGQSIDIGATHAKIFSPSENAWLPFITDISTAEKHEIFGMSLPVISKKDLLWYKSILSRNVDQEDVAQIEKSTRLS